MNDSSQRKVGIVLSYVSIVVSTLIQLLYTPLLIKMLGQSEYGLYSLVSSVIGYLTLLDLGFGNAIVVYTTKYMAKKEYDKVKKLHGMFMVIYSMISLITMALGLILFFNVDTIFGASMTTLELRKAKIMMLILTFNLAINFPFSIYSSIITAYEKFTFQKLMAIANTLIKPILMIPLLFLGYKSITMCIVITISNIIVLLSNYVYCKKKLNIKIKYCGFDKTILKIIFGYSFWVFLTQIVDKANYSVDPFVLGIVSGTVAVSIYSVANSLAQMFINLSLAISNVFLPKVSKMIANNSTTVELSDEWIKIGRLQYYIMFLFTSGFIIFGSAFINLWVGEEYKISYYVALLLIIPGTVPLIQNVGLSIMQAMNKYKFKAIITTIMAVFNIIISIFLAKKYGPIGAAMGTTIALTVCNIFIMNIYYIKVIKLNVIKFWKNIFVMTIKFLVPLLIIILLIRNCNLLNLKNFFVCGIIYVILFCFFSYFFVFNEYEKSLVNNILKKLKIRKV